jgi:hypothetical protein
MTPCKKIAYRTKEAAEKAIKLYEDNRPKEKGTMNSYVCIDCNVYHIGHRRPLNQ